MVTRAHFVSFFPFFFVHAPVFYYFCTSIANIVHIIKRNFIARYILLALVLLGHQGCDLIEYHPYDARLEGPLHMTASMTARIVEQCAGKDTLRFAHISDTQRWYDETKELVRAINRRGDIDFVIHTGDLSDFGLTKEFVWQRTILNGLDMPWVCVIGNHDCLGTGEDVYHTMFGDDNFSFNASFAHFTCINTNAFEYDYSASIPDFNFIKHDISAVPDSISQTIVAMHARPGSEQFNNNVLDYFAQMLNNYPGLAFCICGHDHHTEVLHPFDDGVPYYECGSAKTRTYIVYTLTRDSFTYEAVEI